MKTIKLSDSKDIQNIIKRPAPPDMDIKQQVSEIMNRVRTEGDKALREFSKRFDGSCPESLLIDKKRIQEASQRVSPELKTAIAMALKNIEKFHAAQKPSETSLETLPGIRCSLRFTPISKVGLYIPGGSAPLFSSILMLAVPATLAGCNEIIACTPPNPSDELLYTLGLFNLKAFETGGAQAIAAMCFGTESIPAVDKIFGPGNAWVTEAKMQAAANGIAIDMPAGPSEVLVVADTSANPLFVAADLLSQAEHGADSQVILISNSKSIIQQTTGFLNQLVQQIPRKEIALKSLQNSLAIEVQTLEQAMEISNDYAPEHLILSVENPNELAEKVVNAGSVFLGHYCPESAGDYASGTNHTLPTAGAAKAWSGISLLSFMKSITFQEISPRGIQRLSNTIAALARAEKLEAHALAALVRTPQKS